MCSWMYQKRIKRKNMCLPKQCTIFIYVSWIYLAPTVYFVNLQSVFGTIYIQVNCVQCKILKVQRSTNTYITCKLQVSFKYVSNILVIINIFYLPELVLVLLLRALGTYKACSVHCSFCCYYCYYFYYYTLLLLILYILLLLLLLYMYTST